ncbi:SUR7 family protein pun1 [Pleurostoma richardsiae]|uniref:SUR7 family protein pun1 n=1 Tax=Pleurostoma richardsiae TaxID=41990 RepID=A0AA38RSY0_9PEZI|nr:SUR7 family protein pun1 [Pleurostoma richardsiae]
MPLLPSALRPRLRSRRSAGTISPLKPEKASSTSRTATNSQINSATKARRIFIAVASLSYLIAFVFLILVVIGNTSRKPVIKQTYFFKLDLTNIIPQSVPNADLINSIARTLGLHDFYQVGLWNFCEGYNDEGITSCSKPESLYWFNPVEILLNELLSGATIALPQEVVDILNILRITSHIMFGFFLTGTVLSFVMIFISPLALLSRWWSGPVSIIALIDCILILAATVIATVISFVFKYAVTAQSDLNIQAQVGIRMLVFMWIATGCAFISFVVHSGMCCCCASRRDVKTGRKQIRTDSPEESVTG